MLVLAAALAGCAGTGRTPPPSNEAAPAEPPLEGQLGKHRFTIALAGATLVRSEPAIWSWRLGTGEVAVQDVGPADRDSHFLVERSPRTIVRSDGGFQIVTEVVLVVAGRVFSCTHEERVPDPDAPEARAVVDRGLAVCSSLRVEP
jgi:hypothetical protein